MTTERLTEILGEAIRAQDKFGDFTSTHEALGVLIEEMDELRDAIRANTLDGIGKEARQVAAVALRLYAQCVKPQSAFLKRSNLV